MVVNHGIPQHNNPNTTPLGQPGTISAPRFPKPGFPPPTGAPPGPFNTRGPPPGLPPNAVAPGSTGPPGPVGPDGTSLSDFDGKRLRKTMMRKTVDYNSSFINMLNNRIWQRDYRDRRAIQPDVCFYPDLLPPMATQDNPVNAVTTRFVKTATNKMRCPIFCLAWTPEGRRLVTGASSGEFTLWNGLTFNFETILQAHDSPVRAMEWSHNDVWMVTGDHGGYIKYWQSNMNNVKMFQAHKEPIRRVSFSPTDSKFASCSDDGTVRIWDFQRCVEEKVLRGHGADVKCVDWHPQKGIVVSGSKDNQQPIKLWEPKSGTTIATIHAHKSTVMDLQWNDNGNWLLSASRDHLLKLFDIRNLKEEVQTFRGHKKEASAVSWHPQHEGVFASGGSDGSIMFWNVGADKEIGVIEQAHESIVWCLAWHPVGHILVTGSNDHTVKFWTRNRPGDSMRDKYNLNTLPAGQEEDYGNTEVGAPERSIPGMAPEDRVEGDARLSIPGLDFSGPSLDPLIDQRKLPFAKPIPENFQSNWNKAGAEPDRGVKRSFGEREGSGHRGGPGQAQDNRKENVPPMNSISLQQLQQEATAIVAKGQIIPIVPGSPLYHAIVNGEGPIKDILSREFNIGAGMGVNHLQGAGSQGRERDNNGSNRRGGNWGGGGNQSRNRM